MEVDPSLTVRAVDQWCVSADKLSLLLPWHNSLHLTVVLCHGHEASMSIYGVPSALM